VLIEALPYISEFKGMTVVIKYSGTALNDDKIKKTIVEDVALMKIVGFNPVVIHSGGSDINNSVVKELTLQKVKASGINGIDGNMFQLEKLSNEKEEKKQEKENYMRIINVDTTLIDALVKNNFVPVISPVGMDVAGNIFDIEANHVAVSVAHALHAEKLIFLSDVQGILENINDQDSLISRIKVGKMKEMLKQEKITGGMKAKVNSCIDAVDKGVNNIHILDGRLEHSIILEIFTKKGIGTLIEG
ncbi:MAG: hypothetical protein ACRCSK_03935, partial [Fusobacteriaceae bacterium]